MRWPRREKSRPCTGVSAFISAMSAPATNAFGPAPVSTTHAHGGSSAAASKAACRASRVAAFSALSLSGRLTVMRADGAVVGDQQDGDRTCWTRRTWGLVSGLRRVRNFCRQAAVSRAGRQWRLSAVRRYPSASIRERAVRPDGASSPLPERLFRMKLRLLAATVAALTLARRLRLAQDTSTDKGKLSYALRLRLRPRSRRER